MSLDWTILHGIHDALTCPFLDFLMPKITALGNGGAIWLAAAGGMLRAKKYRKQGVLLPVSYTHLAMPASQPRPSFRR